MKFSKTVLAPLEMVYAVHPLELNGWVHFLAATEIRGPCLLFSPPDWKPQVVWEGPGGTMNLVPVPGQQAFLAIQEFFPVFQSEKAGVVWAEPAGNPAQLWTVRRILDLPFVHRIEAVRSRDADYLVAATLCGGKDFRDDWSKPGAVYAGRIPARPSEPWPLRTILSAVSKNHGLHATILGGQQVVLISGHEGVFALHVPETIAAPWTSELLIRGEISYLFVFDLDSDGQAELVTIEPFHGNTLGIYKRRTGQWQKVHETAIAFGHAIWAGRLRDQTGVLVGNRAGDKELLWLRVTSANPIKTERVVVDRNVGPAQVCVVSQPGETMILSANHGAGEVSLYTSR